MKEVEEIWEIIEKYKASQQNNIKLQENGTNKPKKIDDSANGSVKESTINNNDGEPNESSENGIKKKKKKSKVEKTLENGNTEMLIKTENNIDNQQEVKKSKKKKQSTENECNFEKMDINMVEENADIKDKKNNILTKQKNEEVTDSKLSQVAFANGNSIKTDLSNGNQEIGIKKSKKKKSLDIETEEVNSPKKIKLEVLNEESSTDTQANFDFKQKILDILTSKGSISTKKLEKKVVKAYMKHSGLSESTPKIVKKFNKKLKKLNNVEIVDENVILKT